MEITNMAQGTYIGSAPGFWNQILLLASLVEGLGARGEAQDLREGYKAEDMDEAVDAMDRAEAWLNENASSGDGQWGWVDGELFYMDSNWEGWE